MVKAITPFSTRAKEGATDAPLGDFVKVEQEILSTAQAGFYDKNTGKLEGVVGSDKLFTIDDTHESVPNGGSVLSPQVTPQYIDMTGFNSLFIALKITNAGGSHYAIEAVMGPNDVAFSNLSPTNAGELLDGSLYSKQEFQKLFGDSSYDLTADAWNIMYLQDTLQNQKVLQFKITNNSGGASDIDFAYMRCV